MVKLQITIYSLEYFFFLKIPTFWYCDFFQSQSTKKFGLEQCNKTNHHIACLSLWSPRQLLDFSEEGKQRSVSIPVHIFFISLSSWFYKKKEAGLIWCLSSRDKPTYFLGQEGRWIKHRTFAASIASITQFIPLPPWEQQKETPAEQLVQWSEENLHSGIGTECWKIPSVFLALQANCSKNFSDVWLVLTWRRASCIRLIKRNAAEKKGKPRMMLAKQEKHSLKRHPGSRHCDPGSSTPKGHVREIVFVSDWYQSPTTLTPFQFPDGNQLQDSTREILDFVSCGHTI